MQIINDFSDFFWINEPPEFQLEKGILKIATAPQTDYWQRTYYGFRNDNAHSFVASVKDSQFSFTVKTAFEPKKLFDQCGIVLYQNSDNWVKASIEFDNGEFSRLGSVVTNLGYSDWASVDISTEVTEMHYRLSRREQDFLIECSEDGKEYKQMRIFHMHIELAAVNVGVYACSPLDSSIQAVFSQVYIGECVWKGHEV